MLVKGVFWCWLKGRFGGASLLMDGRGKSFGGRSILDLEGAFWWRAYTGWVGRGFKVQKYTLEIQK